MLFGNFIHGLYDSWNVGSSTLPHGLGCLWDAAKMRLGLGVTGIAISLVVATAQADCPDYTTYAQVNGSMIAGFISYSLAQSPQGSPSSGPLGLPYMRPDPACRTFNSISVEVCHMLSW